MKLSVCVVNYQSEDDLRKFLGTFSDFRPDCLHEVIVVDNSASEEKLSNLKEEFGDWVSTLSPQKNLGFGAAQNRAVKRAKGEYVLLCNPDLEIQDESVTRLLQFADQEPTLGIVGPLLLHSDGSVQDSSRRFPTFADLVIKRLGLSRLFPKKMRRYLMQDRKFDKPTEVDWLVGAAMLMRKDRFEELGGFDEDFFLFFEDTDLCRRMKEAGYSVQIHPDAMMIHSKRRLSERGFWPFKKVFWIHLGSALKYFAKWRKGAKIRGPKS